MRHDWTLLCNEVIAPPSRGIDLLNVISTIEVADRFRRAPVDARIGLESRLWLVSQWTAEFEADRRLHSGVLQLMAPGGDHVLEYDQLSSDFRDKTVSRVYHRISEMKFVGLGTYEFHVMLAGFAVLGEWGRACLTLR